MVLDAASEIKDCFGCAFPVGRKPPNAHQLFAGEAGAHCGLPSLPLQ